jgi:tetratricopeptide (TPR) repeat protein
MEGMKWGNYERFFFYGALGILGFVFSCFTVYNTDFGFSIRMGESLVQQRTIPTETIFLEKSIPRATPDDKWLFHVLFYFFYTMGGIGALVFFRICLVEFFVFLLYGTFRRFLKEESSLLLTMGVLLGCSEQLMIRASLVSMLFFALFLWILSRRPFRFSSGVILVFLLGIWANFHAYFVLGQALFFWSMGVGIFFKDSFKPQQRVLLCVGALCLPLVNPQGWRQYQFPLEIFYRLMAKSEFYQGTLSELVSPWAYEDFPTWMIWVYQGFAVLGFLGFVWRLRSSYREEGYFRSLGWFLGFFLFSLLVRKNVVLFLMVASVVLAEHGAFFALRYPRILERFFGGWKSVGLVFLIYGYVFWLVSTNTLYLEEGRQQRVGWGLSPQVFPEKALDYALRHELPLPLFNTYEIGSYLVYRAFPQSHLRPFILTDYGSGGLELVQRYQEILQADLKKIPEGFQTFILKHSSGQGQALIRQLLYSPEYEWVYGDEIALIFVHRSFKGRFPQELHLELTESFKSVWWCREIPWKAFNLANLYALMGTSEANRQARSYYEQVLAESPGYGKALLNLASLEAEEGNKEVALERLEALLKRYPRYSKAVILQGILYYERGLVALEQGKRQPAQEDFYRSLECFSRYETSVNGLSALKEKVERVLESRGLKLSQ